MEAFGVNEKGVKPPFIYNHFTMADATQATEGEDIVVATTIEEGLRPDTVETTEESV